VAARGLLLPTAWDLAAALLVKEIDVFEPHLVLMNGIARPRGPLVLETGALNHASVRSDVMGLIPLEPRVTSVAEREVSLALPWEVVEDAARAKLAEPRAHADILTGVERGVPRESNGFVCNATAFLVGLAMDGPGRVVHVLESSHEPDRVELVLRRDHRRTPRGFLHWPSELSRGGAAAAAGVLVELIRATLDAELQSDEASPAHEQD
jgi:hypothetical protein